MIGHDYIAIYFQRFMIAAIIQTIYHYISVCLTRENIYPINNGASDKV
jgi:hypothetical protein